MKILYSLKLLSTKSYVFIYKNDIQLPVPTLTCKKLGSSDSDSYTKKKAEQTVNQGLFLDPLQS